MAREIPVILPVSGAGSVPPPAPGPQPDAAPPLPPLPDVGLAYEVNRETGAVIIRIVDRATQEVIREIPPEEVQRRGRAMDALLGRLLDRKG
ncbi:MAG: flagellar protein FlaG [Candidatus Methylomirabilales bacterium]